jgi:transglutaminase-like putative cysteine protease
MPVAPASGQPSPAASRPRWRRILAAPPTGWSSLLLLAVMLGVAGLVLDAPQLAGVGPHGRSQTAFLAPALLLGGAAGFLLARLPLPTGLAHPVGAALGSAFVLIAAADAVSSAPGLGERLMALNASAARLFGEVFVDRQRTGETSGFLLVVGSIAWTTGYFAAFNLFRRAAVAPGVVAVATMVLVVCLSPSVDVAALYPFLVVLTGAALLLILRTNLAHQQLAWRRRQIGDGRAVEGLYLRGGVLVSLVALLGAVALAANVAAAPLADAWRSFDRLPDIANELDRLFGGIRSRAPDANGSFGERTAVQGTWESGTDVVFTVVASDGRGYYWTGATYDRFDGAEWRQEDLDRQAVDAFAELLAASADAVSGSLEGLRTVRLAVTGEGLLGDTLLSPATPLTVDRDASVLLVGDGGPLAEVEFRERLPEGGSYTVEARVPVENGDGLTQNRLAAAGWSYPAWAKRYTGIDAGTLSDSARGTMAALVRQLDDDRRDPFHVAKALEDWFARTGGFDYALDVTDVCLPTEGVVDCLLRSKVGFCQHYATSMTLMLRSQSIPARYVQGYLPGQRIGERSWAVEEGAAHAWVEVYFPSYGWVRFDPTPGGNAVNGQRQNDLPVGAPVPTPEPLDPAAPDPTPVFSDPPTPSPDPAIAPVDGGPVDPILPHLPWPAILLGGLAVASLLLVVIAIARLRRLPGREPDLLYRGIVALATRAGRGPRPTETAYEFTASLAEAVPGVTRELHAVAHAKVEATYGGQGSAGIGIDALVDAYRRARRALLRLAIRRRTRRGGG